MSNSRDFVIETQVMSGVLSEKLRVIREAGFQKIIVDTRDLVSHPQGLELAIQELRRSELEVVAVRMLNEVVGLATESNAYRTELVKNYLDFCLRLNSSMLLVGASGCEKTQISLFASDLRKLAIMALPLNIKVAVQTPFFPSYNLIESFDCLCEADFPNLGLALPIESWMKSGASVEDLEMLDMDQVFLVQTTDSLTGSGEPKSSTAEVLFAGKNVMPGLGDCTHHISEFLLRLQALRYKGLISLCTQNGDQEGMTAQSVALMARQSALWLGYEVMRTSAPLPEWVRQPST